MQFLNIFHVLIAIAMVALVLVQRGAGATAGAAFGSGASGTVFGSRGAGTFLTKSTWVLATLFCAISLTMAVVVSRTANTPVTDLGVVSAPDETSQTEIQPPVIEQSVSSGEASQEDLPELLNEAAEQPVSDLPSVDQAVGEPAIPDQAEEATDSGISSTKQDES